MSHGPLSDLSNITRRYLDRTWFRVAGAVITLLVFSAGLAGFLMLDKDNEELGVLGCIYATCKLFLFHGEAESLSWHHGHHFAVTLISIAAFGGPVLTTAVLALFVGQVANMIRDRQSVHATGHAVILGCGREGLHWAKYLHGKRELTIVVVNRNEEGPQLGAARAISKAVLIGDMTVEQTRQRAAIPESEMVVICTGDELANIDTARAVETETGRGGPMIFCRVVSQALLFSMIDSAKNSSSRIRYFNIYDFVANDAIRRTLEKDAGDKPVHLIICGFGRFGQAVLHAAGQDAVLFNRLSAVDVVDLHADELLNEYKFSAPEEDYAILNEERTAPPKTPLTLAQQSGILNDVLWAQLLKEPAEALRLVFICTDKDVTNLVHAMAIERLVKKDHQHIRAIVVMRQLERPQNEKESIVYATMSHSTDEQIARLIGEPA